MAVEFILFRKLLGQKIKALRLDKGLTQEEMEDGDAGLSYRTVQNIETGKSDPSLKTLYRLGERLEVPVGEFFQFPNPKDSKKNHKQK